MALRTGPIRLLSVCFGVGLSIAVLPARLGAQTAAPQTTAASSLADADIERFLLKADVVKTKSTAKGITGSLQATLTDGSLTHDAHIQSIDESKREFQGTGGTEFNFRDSWTFNIAGYKLDRLLGLHMVPVSVSRRYRSKPSAFSWWVDDVAMDEGDRLKKKIAPPDPVSWNQQMQMVRLFDQLIYNVDRNMGNLLITKDWRVWAIDHTRAFRTHDQLKTPNNVTRCDRQVFQRLKDLDGETLKRELGPYLDTWQIRALLARRDAIVKRIESLGAAALFDRAGTGTHAP
jgi:hypothetical protein